MEDKYYSEFISEEFYNKISSLRLAKGIGCFERFEFVFVDSNNYKCKNVIENNLKTTKIDNDILENITNIIVFSYGKWTNYSYVNEKYSFIGIFDLKGNESTINLGSIELNSIVLKQDLYFQTIDITSCNITILHNQFYEYLNRVVSPIYKMISSSLKGYGGKCSYPENRLTMNILPSSYYNYPVWDFQLILDDLKTFGQELNNKLKDTIFDPEIAINSEMLLKIKSSKIQF